MPRKGTREAWLALRLLQHELAKYFGLQRIREKKELQTYLHFLPASLNIWCTYLLYNALYASPGANKSCQPQQICNSVCAIVMIYVPSGCIVERFLLPVGLIYSSFNTLLDFCVLQLFLFEGLVGHKTSGIATGCSGTGGAQKWFSFSTFSVSWKIRTSSKMLVVMYSVPDSHDW